MVQITLDRAEFRAAIAKAIAAGPEARKQATIMVAKEFGKEIQRRSPVYTGRFKRAEAQAINAVGAGPLPLQPITKPKESKWFKGVSRTLAKQVAYWQKRVNEIVASGGQFRYGKKGKKLKGESKAYRYAAKKLLLAMQYQVEWYASGGAAAIMNRKTSSYDSLVRASATIYGGTGVLYQTQEETIVSLRNKEPHAHVVESKKGIRYGALNAVGRDLLQKVGRAYVTRIASASGFKATG